MFHWFLQHFTKIYMGRIHCHGIYGELIAKYIEHKRNLGYKMQRTDTDLASFDKLATERGEEPMGISKELCDIWCMPRPMESNRTRHSRMSSLKGFSLFLNMLGYDSYIPQLPKYQTNFVPHIYSKDEMERIFKESNKVKTNCGILSHANCALPTIIRMLYGTGMRVGEAINLTHGDINVDTGTVLIKGTKNGQQRIVVMSRSLIEVCKDYIAHKEMMELPIDSGSPFFTYADGHPCKKETLGQQFRRILLRAGIPHGGRGNGPRLHDLRHTFCVNSLVQMSEAGLDLYYSLPILMTYIGHQSLEATEQYVRITQAMYPKLLNQVDVAYSSIFPEY